MNTAQELTIGTRVYYTGDNANLDGTGRIANIRANGWLTIEFDEERAEMTVPAAAFHPQPGRRFWPLAEYTAWKEKRMAEFMAAYRATKAAS